MKLTVDGFEYELDVNKAKELGVLKFAHLPMSWDEYVKHNQQLYYYISSRGDNLNSNVFDGCYYDFKTTREARAFAALGKLLKLHKAWVNEFKPFGDDVERYYCIDIMDDGEYCSCTYESSTYTLTGPFTFPTKEMCELFCKTFSTLLNEARIYL